MKRWKWIVIGVVAVAQCVRPARTAEPLDATRDFITVTQPTEEAGTLLREACYDCHSGQPRYPWYMNITPVNWWLQHHIDEAREEGDLSRWTEMSEKHRAHFVDEAAELVNEGEMPLPSYTWMHGNSRLDARQRELLIDHFQSLPEAEVEWRRKR